MINEASRRQYFTTRKGSWDASTMESMAVSTATTKLRTMEVLREQSAKEFLIKPSQLKAFDKKSFSLKACGKTTLKRIVIDDDGCDVKREVSVQGFVDDVAQGKMLQDSSSPLDFLNSIRSGEFLNAFLGMKSPDVAPSCNDVYKEEKELKKVGYGRNRCENGSDPFQNEEEEIQISSVTEIVEREDHGGSIHEFFIDLTTCQMLENGPSAYDFLRAMYSASLDDFHKEAGSNPEGHQDHHEASEVTRLNAENVNASAATAQECRDDHLGSRIDTPDFIVHPASSEGHDTQVSLMSDDLGCLDQDPVLSHAGLVKQDPGDVISGPERSQPKFSEEKKPRYTTVVKEFGVQKGGILGSRRRVAHEITQSKPKPIMVHISNSEKSLRKFKTNAKTSSSRRKGGRCQVLAAY